MAHSSSKACSSSVVASGRAAWRAPKAFLNLMNPLIHLDIAPKKAWSEILNDYRLNKTLNVRMKYLHKYLEKGLNPWDGMPCHEATKYAHNDQLPLTMLPCLGKTPHSE